MILRAGTGGRSATDSAVIGRAAGFTLVELLVSLMILALVLSFVPGALRSGQRIWEIDRRLDQEAALSSFRRYVEQRLAEAMPLQSRLPGRGVVLEFIGEPERVAFVAPGVAGPGGGGIYRFELLLEGAGARSMLVLRQSIFRSRQIGAVEAASSAPALAMERRLHSAVEALVIRYHGAAAANEQAQWLERWPRNDRLPDLVEITFNTAGGTKRMVVPLRLVGPR
jgi:prepilin-type N-terminal cleavage/methylation domain-containing protein